MRIVTERHGGPKQGRSGVQGRGGAKRAKVVHWAIWVLFVLPAVLVFALFAFWPVVQVVLLSFFDWNMISPTRKFVGWQNYADIFGGGGVWQLLWQSLLYILLILIGNFILPVLLGGIVLSVGRRASAASQTILFLPTVIATSVVAVVWLWMLLPVGGLVNTALGAVGILPRNWLNDPGLALATVSAVTSWKFFGFNFIIAMAGLRAVPRDYLDAALIDGAGLFARWRYIVIPMLAPTLVFLGVTTALQALNNAFIPIQIMTHGGPSGSSSNILYAVFEDSFQFFLIGKSTAEAVIMMIALGGLAVWQFRMMDKRYDYAD